MEKNTFGLTSWDEVEIKQGGQKANLYMRLDQGSNVIRCVTKPFQYQVHNYKEEGDTGFGDKVMCSAHHQSCAVCALGDRPKRRWLVGVIERKTQSFKILDIGSQVFKSIKELSHDEDYGEPGLYDIDLKVDKQGGATGYYTVIPKPPKPLSANDVSIKETVDVDDLIRRCTPPTPDKVVERLDAIRNRKAGKAPVAASKPAATKQVQPVDMVGEEEYTFPVVNSN